MTRSEAGPGPRTILISVSPGETRYALLEDDTILDVAFERAGRLASGDRVAGRLGKALGGSLARFVDTGSGPAGFFEVPRAQARAYSEGQRLLFQVIREGYGSKGPKLALCREPGPDTLRAFEAGTDLGRLPGENSILSAWLRDSAGSPPEVICDSGVYLAGWTREPGKARFASVAHHTGTTSLFEVFGVEEAIGQALEERVSLPSGGGLIFAETEALNAVDVDTGAGPRDRGALVAALETIFHQIRLRALGGQIVIDLPRSRAHPLPADLPAVVKTLAARDPAGMRFLGITRGGLLELVRPRTRAPLSDLMCRRSTRQRESSEAALLRCLRDLARGVPGAGVVLDVDDEAFRLLETVYGPAFREAVSRSGMTVRVERGLPEGASLRAAGAV
ncbi:ribonuclease E/G [Phaeovibrio sulfidiphilus]|uniref:Ribonuclease E/G n=1 Tax=Phaeovibrio sulfidiphilus TaxID=1220600 RepID=A0A8J6YNP7_9PROT|nr:ribonuclease E/G [Phaeovibrio sulfidiphilus]MBE1237910.1 ribonuclease E/G [Phaeovibrio sulfidiphilus]